MNRVADILCYTIMMCILQLSIENDCFVANVISFLLVQKFLLVFMFAMMVFMSITQCEAGGIATALFMILVVAQLCQMYSYVIVGVRVARDAVEQLPSLLSAFSMILGGLLDGFACFAVSHTNGGAQP